MIPIVRRFIKASVKLARAICNLRYLRKCKFMGVVPEFIRVRRKCRNFKEREVQTKAEQQLLRIHIGINMEILQTREKEVYRLYRIHISKLHNYWVDWTMRTASFDKEKVFKRTIPKQNKKLKALRARTCNGTNNASSDRMNFCKSQEEIANLTTRHIINMSDVTFNDKHSKLLAMGPKFRLKKSINVNTIIPQVENFVTEIPNEEKTYFRERLARRIRGSLSNNRANSEFKKSMNEIRDIKKQNDLQILKADKSSKMVIMNKELYTQKVDEALMNMKIVEVQKDPTQTIIRKVKAVKKLKVPENIKNACFIPMYAQVPTLFYQVKVHKKDFPFRPMLSKRKSATFHLEKELYRTFRPLVYPYSRGVTCSDEVINKLKMYRLEKNDIFVTMDVVSLYPSTPVEEAIRILLERYTECHKPGNEESRDMKQVWNLVSMNNIFYAKGKLWKQLQGTPIGSSISGILAEVVLQNLESKIFESDMGIKPKLYLRYVDDIFLIWNEQSEGCDGLVSFVQKMNGIYPSIKFTYEIEKESKVTFLDLVIEKEQDRVTFDIHRKQSAVPILIPFNSNHPMSYKLAAFRFFIDRMFRVLSEDPIKMEVEWEYILHMAKVYGYPKKIILHLKHRIQLKNRENRLNEASCLTPLRKNVKKKYICMEYHPNLEVINRWSEGFNIRAAFQVRDTIFDLLKGQFPNGTERKGGVYRIPCKSTCGTKYYIGKTYRSLNIRLKEHKNNIKKGNLSSILVEYVHRGGGEPVWDEAKVIAAPPTRKALEIRETIEILKHGDNAINKECSYVIPQQWLTLLHND